MKNLKSILFQLFAMETNKQKTNNNNTKIMF